MKTELFIIFQEKVFEVWRFLIESPTFGCHQDFVSHTSSPLIQLWETPFSLWCVQVPASSGGSEDAVINCHDLAASLLPIRGFSLVCPLEKKPHVSRAVRYSVGSPMYISEYRRYVIQGRNTEVWLIDTGWPMESVGLLPPLGVQVAGQWTCIWAHWVVAGICGILICKSFCGVCCTECTQVLCWLLGAFLRKCLLWVHTMHLSDQLFFHCFISVLWRSQVLSSRFTQPSAHLFLAFKGTQCSP